MPVYIETKEILKRSLAVRATLGLRGSRALPHASDGPWNELSLNVGSCLQTNKFMYISNRGCACLYTFCLWLRGTIEEGHPPFGLCDVGLVHGIVSSIFIHSSFKLSNATYLCFIMTKLLFIPIIIILRNSGWIECKKYFYIAIFYSLFFTSKTPLYIESFNSLIILLLLLYWNFEQLLKWV